MTKKKIWKMRFLKGSPCTWQGEPYDEERDADEVYTLDITAVGYTRGCSSFLEVFVPTDRYDAYMKNEEADWDDKDHTFSCPEYKVFASDLTDIIMHAMHGRVKDRFKYIKCGTGYGLRLLEAYD